MNRKKFYEHACFLAMAFGSVVSVQSTRCEAQTAAPLGLFEEQGDVGTVLHAGDAKFDSGAGVYSITGSGENMWATADAFHFVWKKYSGDVAITADVAFPTATGNPHKKAVLMIRQSLDANSPYVDAALHVAGLTSLQSRQEKGGATHEVGLETEAATRFRLVKRGAYFYMYVARQGEELHLAGGSMRLELKEPFYIGIGVCAHDKDALETAEFSKVSIGAPVTGKPKLYSTLETISVSSTDQRVVAVFPERVAWPSWSADGTALVFKKGKKLLQIPAAGGPVTAAPVTDAALQKRKRGDKAAPDGQHFAELSYSGKKPMEATLSSKAAGDGKIKILATLLASEGTLGHSPWSPDGKRLVFISYQLVPEE